MMPAPATSHTFSLVRQRPETLELFLYQHDLPTLLLSETGEERDVVADELAGCVLIADRSEASVGADRQLARDDGQERRSVCHHPISRASSSTTKGGHRAEAEQASKHESEAS